MLAALNTAILTGSYTPLIVKECFVLMRRGLGNGCSILEVHHYDS